MTTGKIIQADAINGIVTKPNLVPNSSAILNTLGWTEGSYTAGTRPTGTFTASSGSGTFAVSRTTTSPLGDTGTSIVFTKSSGNQQGRAIQIEFALPLEYRAKVLQLKNAYINTSTNATDFAAGSSTTDSDMIFYAAFSTDGGSTYSVAEPSSFKLLSNSKDISDYFDGSIQTPWDATHMRLIAYVASTSTTAWSIKTTASVSPSTYVFGTPITDWQSYTPTGSWTTNATYTGFWRRVGDSMQVRFNIALSGAPTGNLSDINLPSGYTIDTSKLPATQSSANRIYGVGETKSAASFYPLWMAYQSTTSLRPEIGNASGTFLTDGGVSATQPGTYASGDYVQGTFEVPILGWSSSVQMSDSADTRVVAASYYASSGAVNGGNTFKYTNKLVDTHNSYNTTTGIYIIPTAGIYKLSAMLETASASFTAGGGQNVRLYVNKNGALYTFLDENVLQASGTYSVTVKGLTLIDCKAGDTIEIKSDSSLAVNVNASGDRNHFEIERISGPSAISQVETISALYTGAPPTGTLNSSYNIATFGTKVKDSHGAYSSGSYTIPATGQYNISAAAYVTANWTAGQVFAIGIFVDGSAVNARFHRFEANASSHSLSVETNMLSYPLRAGQVVDIRVRADGSTPSYVSDGAVNQFSIVRSGSY